MATQQSDLLRRIRQHMDGEMDGVLLSNSLHRFYVTGFSFEDGYVAVLKDKAFLFTDFRYLQAANQAVDSSDFTVVEMVSLPAIAKFLQEQKVKKLGYEDRFVTAFDAHRMTAIFAGVSLCGIGGMLEDLRRSKTPQEMDDIRQAQHLTDKAFAHILDYITPEVRETEVALELEFFMRKHGAEAVSFPTIAISGEASSRPHGVPQNRKLERGFLTMDFGCIYHGYCSDMTRTVCVGRPSDDMKKIYETVLAAQRAALEKIAWHASCFEIDRIAREQIDNAGYAGCFGHSLGHGVGLYIHERPSLSPACPKEMILENGDVVTVEPGIYIAGKYGVRIEDMVLIHDNTAEDITHSPKELIVL